ncbi:hypothetical protein AALP_AA7G120900 [Arabis alpina]|uniref:Uncharacterized protein n=1 Tax=Arabis alpina TaxID=50452 RepID=A0A087GHI7_ARAAL|nr:hypothetical protein AALP_AA7G120900 [Arabis alpina]
MSSGEISVSFPCSFRRPWLLLMVTKAQTTFRNGLRASYNRSSPPELPDPPDPPRQSSERMNLWHCLLVMGTARRLPAPVTVLDPK